MRMYIYLTVFCKRQGRSQGISASSESCSILNCKLQMCTIQ